MRLIDADVLKPKILEYVKALERIKYCYGYDTFGKYYNGKKSAYLNVANLIDEAPTVEERKHGHWLNTHNTQSVIVACVVSVYRSTAAVKNIKAALLRAKGRC